MNDGKDKHKISAVQKKLIGTTSVLSGYSKTISDISGRMMMTQEMMNNIKSTTSILGSLNTAWMGSITKTLDSSIFKSTYGDIFSNITNTMNTLESMIGSVNSIFSQTVKFNESFANLSNILSIAVPTEMNILGTISEITPELPEISIQPLTETQKDKLGTLLDNLNPSLNKKREGAWEVLGSGSPDRVSQCANSTVELLRHTIKSITSEKDWKIGLKVYLEDKYESKSLPIFVEETTKWVESTIEYIEALRNKIEGVKHSIDFEHENVAKGLLITTEGVLLVLLDV